VVVTDSSGKDNILIKSYVQKMDLNSDQNQDLDLTLNFWDEKTANISIKLYGEGLSETPTTTNTTVTNASSLQVDKTETIIKKTQEEAIICDLTFQDESFVRYKIDDKQDMETYQKTGNALTLNASKTLVIMLSNAGAGTINFKGYNKSFKIGDSGKIELKLIKWVKNANGENELQISSIK